jgi:hypothetical protein
VLTMIKVFVPVGPSTDFFDDQVDGFGATIATPWVSKVGQNLGPPGADAALIAVPRPVQVSTGTLSISDRSVIVNSRSSSSVIPLLRVRLSRDWSGKPQRLGAVNVPHPEGGSHMLGARRTVDLSWPAAESRSSRSNVAGSPGQPGKDEAELRQHSAHIGGRGWRVVPHWRRQRRSSCVSRASLTVEPRRCSLTDSGIRPGQTHLDLVSPTGFEPALPP